MVLPLKSFFRSCCRYNKRIFHTVLAATLLALGVASTAAEDFLIPFGAEWRYYATTTDPDKSWHKITFADDRWRRGIAGFGYGDGDDTTVLKNMRNRFTEVYIRHSFDIVTPPKTLYLYIRYDDAFTAYLNGNKVASSGYRGNRPTNNEADQLKVFELKSKHLIAGRNVLAIKGENVNINSSDFSLNPALASQPVNFDILTREVASRELGRLRARLINQGAYLNLTDRNAIDALDHLADNLPEKMLRIDLLRAMQRLVAMIGDGHASVGGEFERNGAQYLPFSFAESSEGIIAVDVSQNRIVGKDYPLVMAIDGIETRQWLAQAALYVSRASEQLNRRRALRAMRRLDLLRRDFDLPQSDTAAVTFANTDGDLKVSTLQLTNDRPRTARISIGTSRTLDDNIGYMVIPAMDNDLIPDLLELMQQFKNTNALIIDVRGNGGGRYGILQALAGYFLPPQAGPVVVNIAAYRLAPHFGKDHLASRPTFRQSHEGWLARERDVIQTALKSFKPIWTPPEGKFSEWHFMVLNRKSDHVPAFSYYGKPVVVLSNAESFSASDGFLAAFGDFPNVTIMGQPSSGGSGRTQRFTLPETDIRVALSSMASFRPNGKLFDGYGVEVDIHVEPRLEDFVGTSDYVLQRALTYIKEMAK